MEKKQPNNILNTIIAIIATAITIAGIFLYPHVMKYYNFNKIASQVESLAQNIKTYKESHDTYKDISVEYLLENDLLPEDTIAYDEDPIIYSKYGQLYKINEATTVVDEINNGAYVINFQNLSQEMCERALQYDWTKLKGVDFLGLSASIFTITGDVSEIVDNCNGMYNPKGLLYACPNGETVSIPVPQDKAQTVCECIDYNSCSIIFKFK